MNWAALLFYGWLTVAWLPNGSVDMYTPPKGRPIFLDVSNSGYVELGAEVTWGFLFVAGSMNVPVWQVDGALEFWPTELVSTVDLGIKFPGIRFGYTHSCAHAVTPGLGMIQWDKKQIVPGWDSSYDAIYLTISGGEK